MSKESEDKVGAIHDMVKAIHECLYGNSNPGTGLTDRVTKIETEQTWMKKQQKWIVRLVIVAIGLLLTLLGVKELPSVLGFMK